MTSDKGTVSHRRAKIRLEKGFLDYRRATISAL